MAAQASDFIQSLPLGYITSNELSKLAIKHSGLVVSSKSGTIAFDGIQGDCTNTVVHIGVVRVYVRSSMEFGFTAAQLDSWPTML